MEILQWWVMGETQIWLTKSANICVYWMFNDPPLSQREESKYICNGFQNTDIRTALKKSLVLHRFFFHRARKSQHASRRKKKNSILIINWLSTGDTFENYDPGNNRNLIYKTFILTRAICWVIITWYLKCCYRILLYFWICLFKTVFSTFIWLQNAVIDAFDVDQK